MKIILKALLIINLLTANLSYAQANSSDDGSMIVGMIFAIILLCIYFLPTILNSNNKYKSYSTFLIFLLNLFLGWTLLFWFLLLMMAKKQDLSKILLEKENNKK